MNRAIKKEQILTIPNLLSLIRLLLIPLIVWLYCIYKNYYMAVSIIILSGITDVIDGIIARKFNMVSDFGKILDPVADKLTQATMIICLIPKHRWMIALIALFLVKECIVSACGLISIKKYKKVHSAKWFGKSNTVTLYAVMIILFFFPDISKTLAYMLGGLCAISMLFSLVMYVNFLIISPNKKNE